MLKHWLDRGGALNFANTKNKVGTRAKAEAEHKELINQYKTFKGVRLGTKDLILEAVVNKYLIEIENEMLGFLNKTPKQMLEHWLDRGGALDFADTKNLIAERDGEWNINKNPVNLLQQSGEGNEKSCLKWNQLRFKQTKRHGTVPFKSNRPMRAETYSQKNVTKH